MPDTDVDHKVADHEVVDHEVTAEVRDEPVDVTAEVIVKDENRAEPEHRRVQALRDLLVRQLDVGHDLGAELLEAATNVSVAVAHAPASVVGEIRSGATLPFALTQSGTAVREVVSGAGATLRTAVGDYVGHQATLPNAVVVGASEVAESVLRAQGRVAASTMAAAFAVATTVVHGGDIRESLDRERRSVSSTTDVGRETVAGSWDRALEEMRTAVTDFDELLVDAE